MQKIKKAALFVGFLALATFVCFSAVSAEEQNREQNREQNNKEINGEEHRSAVSTYVQGLLDVADRENDGIGEEVKAVAKEQNDSKDKVAEAIDKVQNRNRVKTFLIGTDYKNIGELRSEMVKTGSQVDQLKRLLDKTTDAANKTALQAQIQSLESEQKKIDDFLKANESKFSLFGWFVKLFIK